MHANKNYKDPSPNINQNANENEDKNIINTTVPEGIKVDIPYLLNKNSPKIHRMTPPEAICWGDKPIKLNLSPNLDKKSIRKKDKNNIIPSETETNESIDDFDYFDEPRDNITFVDDCIIESGVIEQGNNTHAQTIRSLEIPSSESIYAKPKFETHIQADNSDDIVKGRVFAKHQHAFISLRYTRYDPKSKIYSRRRVNIGLGGSTDASSALYDDNGTLSNISTSSNIDYKPLASVFHAIPIYFKKHNKYIHHSILKQTSWNCNRFVYHMAKNAGFSNIAKMHNTYSAIGAGKNIFRKLGKKHFKSHISAGFNFSPISVKDFSIILQQSLRKDNPKSESDNINDLFKNKNIIYNINSIPPLLSNLEQSLENFKDSTEPNAEQKLLTPIKVLTSSINKSIEIAGRRQPHLKFMLLQMRTYLENLTMDLGLENILDPQKLMPKYQNVSNIPMAALPLLNKQVYKTNIENSYKAAIIMENESQNYWNSLEKYMLTPLQQAHFFTAKARSDLHYRNISKNMLFNYILDIDPNKIADKSSFANFNNNKNASILFKIQKSLKKSDVQNRLAKYILDIYSNSSSNVSIESIIMDISNILAKELIDDNFIPEISAFKASSNSFLDINILDNYSIKGLYNFEFQNPIKEADNTYYHSQNEIQNNIKKAINEKNYSPLKSSPNFFNILYNLIYNAIKNGFDKHNKFLVTDIPLKIILKKSQTTINSNYKTISCLYRINDSIAKLNGHYSGIHKSKNYFLLEIYNKEATNYNNKTSKPKVLSNDLITEHSEILDDSNKYKTLNERSTKLLSDEVEIIYKDTENQIKQLIDKNYTPYKTNTENEVLKLIETLNRDLVRSVPNENVRKKFSSLLLSLNKYIFSTIPNISDDKTRNFNKMIY